MIQDEYSDFISWKKNLNKIQSGEYFDKHGLKTTQYKKWKYQNDIGNYDERVLIKMYEMDVRLRVLESIMLEAYEGEV